MDTRKTSFIVFSLLLISSIALYGIFNDYTNDTKRIENIEQVQIRLKQLTYIDEIITQLQKERGLSAIYFEDSSVKYYEALKYQKEATQLTFDKVQKYIDIKDIIGKRNKAVELIKEKHTFTRLVAFLKYTSIIKSLLLQSDVLIVNTINSDIKNSLIYYNHLNIMQETAGQLRGLISGIIASQNISRQEYNEIVILNRIFEEHYKRAKLSSNFFFPLNDPKIQESISTINKIIAIENVNSSFPKNITIEPLQWFKKSSFVVDTVRDNIKHEIEIINNIIDTSMQEAQDNALRHTLLWSCGSILIFISAIVAWILSQKLFEERKLLLSYKNVIDNNPNSIVSKTDQRGVITYANDTFCKVSKYTQDELVGKPHSIVRSKDIEKSVFKDLWKTIKSGKTWSGIVKNKAKDGTPYWVDAYISPIFDSKGNLVEYIAMRHNITETILQTQEIERTQKELIFRMGESVEARSKESGQHIKRVAHYSKELALLFGIDEEKAEMLFITSTMHDIGKIAIPDSILLKNDKLTEDEIEIMKTHTSIGYKILSDSNLPLLKMASKIAYQHHEYYNGQGYPQGLAGDKISIYARIVAIADVFDALVSDRIYKKAWLLEDIINMFNEDKGKHFDPVLTQLFVKNIKIFLDIKKRYSNAS